MAGPILTTTLYAPAVQANWIRGYARAFVEEGRPQGELLARLALRESSARAYAQRLLAAFGAADSTATSTTKKHMENIHGKLYVRSRTQAVARARELGLL